MSERDLPSSERRRLSVRSVLWIVVGILIVTFVLQNTQSTQVEFLFFDFESGVWFALIVALAIGAGVGYVLGRNTRNRRDRD